MIYRFRKGTPYETEAVVSFENVAEVNAEEMDGRLREYGISLQWNEGLDIVCGMEDDTAVYGLGEANRGINKRGYIYRSDNTDEPHQSEEKTSFYGSHNFIVVNDSSRQFGLFVDCPEKVVFDIGYTESELLEITSEAQDMYICLIEGNDINDIVKQFRKAIGQSYIAPLWAFGYQQSRWGYKCEDDIRAVVDGYRDSGIGLDAVYMDIDYMQDYKDFTVNEERFPSFPDFVSEMRGRGIRLVPIIDAGVKTEPGYDVYEEGVAKGYFCEDGEGKLFRVGVWPGWTHFPDFIRPEVREWFGSLYGRLTAAGIEGFWNDMNEPAVFYTQKSVDRLRAAVKKAAVRDDPDSDLWEVRNAVDTIREKALWSDIYHRMPEGRICHDRLHNVYGYRMTQAAAEGLKKLLPGKQALLFSRSSYIGMHRCSGIWMGDNQSWWSHLLMNLRMLPGLNMCGFLYTGADVGGFGSDTTEDLLLRWIAFAAFVPLMRNHSALGTRNQECWRFPHKEMFRELIALRYRMIPYLYSEYLKGCENGTMMFRPLAFDYADDPIAVQTEDQLMLGDGLMIAPVYVQNASGRFVYLPERMYRVHFRTSSDYEITALEAGAHYVELGLGENVVFLKPGAMLPLGDAVSCTDEMKVYSSGRVLTAEDFEIIAPESAAEYDLAVFDTEKHEIRHDLLRTERS